MIDLVVTVYVFNAVVAGLFTFTMVEGVTYLALICSTSVHVIAIPPS